MRKSIEKIKQYKKKKLIYLILILSVLIGVSYKFTPQTLATDELYSTKDEIVLDQNTPFEDWDYAYVLVTSTCALGGKQWRHRFYSQVFRHCFSETSKKELQSLSQDQVLKRESVTYCSGGKLSIDDFFYAPGYKNEAAGNKDRDKEMANYVKGANGRKTSTFFIGYSKYSQKCK